MHDDDARRPDAALADCEQGAHAELAHLFLVDDLDGQTGEVGPGEGGGALCHALRVELVGRLGHQVAGEGDRLGGSPERAIGLCRLGRHRRHDGDRFQRGFSLGLLLGAVFVEAVGAQRRAEGEAGGSLGRFHLGLVADIDRKTRLGLTGAVELDEEIAAKIEHLTLAQIHAALAYYHANREEIDSDIAAEEAAIEKIFPAPAKLI